MFVISVTKIKRFTHRYIGSIFISSISKQKQMPKKQNKSVIDYFRSTPVLVALSVGVCVLAILVPKIVRADQLQDQINALSNANSNIQSDLVGLQGQASSYQSTINSYQAQINSITAALEANQTQQTNLQNQITANKAELVTQKSILADDIRTMYINSSLTPIEMLATSNSLSNFVDQQVSYASIQNKIVSTVAQINSLQTTLQDQSTQLNALIQTQQTQQSTLVADQNQVNSLLSYNQQQQDQFNSQIQSNNRQISALEAEQAAANASVAVGVKVNSVPSDGSGGLCDIGEGNGGYPTSLCNKSQDSVTDNSGFPNRECTSFANWYFTTVEGQGSFSVNGNAGWWYLTSNYPAITWSGGVTPGALGIEPSSSLDAPVPSLHGGYYGHVMVVLALPGTTYDGSFPYTSAVAGTQVPAGDVLVMSMNEDEEGHFLYDFWPINYLMYINPQ